MISLKRKSVEPAQAPKAPKTLTAVERLDALREEVMSLEDSYLFHYERTDASVQFLKGLLREIDSKTQELNALEDDASPSALWAEYEAA